MRKVSDLIPLREPDLSDSLDPGVSEVPDNIKRTLRDLSSMVSGFTGILESHGNLLRSHEAQLQQLNEAIQRLSR
jgi:hypothetical protein